MRSGICVWWLCWWVYQRQEWCMHLGQLGQLGQCYQRNRWTLTFLFTVTSSLVDLCNKSVISCMSSIQARYHFLQPVLLPLLQQLFAISPIACYLLATIQLTQSNNPKVVIPLARKPEHNPPPIMTSNLKKKSRSHVNCIKTERERTKVCNRKVTGQHVHRCTLC